MRRESATLLTVRRWVLVASSVVLVVALLALGFSAYMNRVWLRDDYNRGYEV